MFIQKHWSVLKCIKFRMMLSMLKGKCFVPSKAEIFWHECVWTQTVENKLKAWINSKNNIINWNRREAFLQSVALYWQENTIDIRTIRVEKLSIIQNDIWARTSLRKCWMTKGPWLRVFTAQCSLFVAHCASQMRNKFVWLLLWDEKRLNR